MKYELWKSGNSYSFFPENDTTLRGLLDADAKRLTVIEAETWEDAQRLKHEFLGWEPYKPMESER
jgi:hypothetical protein